MSLVSSLLSLTQRCTIERNGASTSTGWGTPGPPDWQQHAADVPCWHWATAGREDVDDQTSAVVETLHLLLPVETDVTEQDRIGDVTYRGALVLAGPTTVRAILRREDHLELILVRVS